MAVLAAVLMDKGEVRSSILVVMLFYTYCRPGELRSARRRQLLRPLRARGPLSLWNICLAPQEDDPQAVQSTTKVGTVDDTIILDKPEWLVKVIKI